MKTPRKSTGATVAALVTAGLLASGAVAAPAMADSRLSAGTFVAGLHNPRGIAFDGQGHLYVAEAGEAGAGESGANRSGAVSAFGQHGGLLWSTPLTSIYEPSPDGSGGVDVLGPAAVGAVGNGCMKHSAGERNGCRVLGLVSESLATAVELGIDAPDLGKLFRLDGASGDIRSVVSDVGAQQYQWTTEHAQLAPRDFPDSNPYAVLVTRNGTYVADAGANTISEVMKDGTNRVIAYIPNNPVTDSTPTCIAEGPDHALYVGTLDLVPNVVPGLGGPGQSRVYRVDPKASYPTAPTLWATGLTTVNGCTFDDHGTFWASELLYPNPGGPPGDLVTIPFRDPSSLQHMAAGQVPLPAGIAQGPDGAMYVSIFSATDGHGPGAVVRLSGH